MFIHKHNLLQFTPPRTGFVMSIRKYLLLRRVMLGLTFFLMQGVARADYTIPSGSSVNASTLTGQSGVLTINGTLLVSSNVSLLNFTTVIINGPDGQIYWQNNSDLRFTASVTITINNGAPGLQPVGGNASKRLIIGTTIIAVSNDNSNNAAFSFDEFNIAGGLPQFLVSGGATICYGTAFTATITPVNNTLNYDCSWTVNNGGTVSPATSSNFNTPQTVTLTPTNSATQKTYTVSCTVRKAGDPDAITTKSLTVVVNPAPAAPTDLLASPAQICAGSSAALTATSTGNTISWYAVASGGSALGNVGSGTGFSVSPASTTTYYAAARRATTGCESITRPSVTVTVNQPSVGGTVSGAAVVCAGTNSSVLTLSGFTGSISRWESSTDNFATAPVQIPFTGASLTVSNISTATAYRAVVQNGFCSAALSNVVLLAVANPGNWLGVDSNWNNPLNWCNGSIPDLNTDVVIPNGLLRYPEINSLALARNITVATGGTARITVNHTLRIAGSISASQGIRATNGTIDFAGNAPQLFRADAFDSASIGSLVISNTTANASTLQPSVAILPAGGNLRLLNQVSFGNVNNAVLETADSLVLVSSATATAAVADLTNNGANNGNAISGRVEIQRYIPGRRAWRLLGVPVTAASGVTIHNSWQEGAVPVSNPSVILPANNPNPGYGTHITYGFPATNGYDQGINGNTSIRYLTATGWNGVPAATNNGALPNTGRLSDQPGYMLFVRGDRGTPLSAGVSAVLSPTVLRMKGFLNMGQLDLPLHSGLSFGSSRFRVVGNPYPSAVNFHKIMQHPLNQAAGFEDAYYEWDAKLTGTNGVGGWVALSYNSSTGTYDRTAVAGGSTAIGGEGDIQSGSAIVINYPGAATSLRVEEPHKSSGSNSFLFRPRSGRNELRVQLLARNSDQTVSVNDGVLVTFSPEWTNDLTAADMLKLGNFAENLSVMRNDTPLILERRNLLQATDSILLALSQLRVKSYALELQADHLNIPAGSMAVLEDQYLSVRQPLQVPGTTRYDFAVTSDPASSRAGRFRVRIQPLAEFSGPEIRVQAEDIHLNWTLTHRVPELSAFEVQRSADGQHFETLGRVEAGTTGSTSVSFRYTDLRPGTGTWQYRLRAVSAQGAEALSRTVSATVLSPRQGIYVYPNPVRGRTIGVRFNEASAGQYQALLLSSAGEQLQQYRLTVQGGSQQAVLALPQQLAPGIYQLRLRSNQGATANLQVVVVD